MIELGAELRAAAALVEDGPARPLPLSRRSVPSMMLHQRAVRDRLTRHVFLQQNKENSGLAGLVN